MRYGKTYIESVACADSSIHPIKPRQLPKDNGVRSIIALNVLERAFHADGPNRQLVAHRAAHRRSGYRL